MSSKQIDELRKNLGTDSAEVVYIPVDVQRSAFELSDEHFSTDSMVAAWVKANEDWIKTNLPDVAHDDLMAYGRSVLAAIQEKS